MVRKNFFIRLAIIAILLLLVACLVYFAFLVVMPDLIPVLKNGDTAQIESYLLSIDKITGLLCTVLLQIVQVFSIVLPGTPIQIAAGIVYGIWRSFLVCHLSYVAANILVFLVARRLGARIDKMMPVGVKSAKLDFINKSQNPAYMIALAYLNPIIPSGFIPYVAAETKIKSLHFAMAAYIGSFLPVFIFCAAGSKILAGDYALAVLPVAALMILAIILAKFKNKVFTMLSSISEKLKRHR